ncbi:MAG TPA: hypothetical protein DDW50_03085, partial [Firmicutes bacterium]|nr:hypothetical protein [Bacillota bacterium]
MLLKNIMILTCLINVVFVDSYANAKLNLSNRIIAVASGMRYTLALKSDGTVWAWGNNDYGQLGDGTTTNRNIPVQVKGLSNVVAIAGSESFSMALKKDGTVWAWGRGEDTRNNSKEYSSSPLQVKGLKDIIAMNAGTSASIAINKEGMIWAWGDVVNWGSGKNSFLPSRCFEFGNVKKGTCGFHFCLVVKNDGTIWEWGWDKTTRDPDAPGIKTYGKPFMIQDIDDRNMKNVTEVCGFLGYFLALKKDGTVWEWEENEGSPTKIKIDEVISIGRGYEHGLAAKQDGSVWGWGLSTCGQLGNGQKTKSNSSVVRVKDLANIKEVSCGEYHSIALSNDGTVWAWGLNDK